MKKDKFPFKLNMPYEELEFDLEPIKDRVKGYDSYLYIEQIAVFGIFPKKIELVFYWEQLKIIIIEFEQVDLSKVAKLTKLKFIKINNLYVKATFKIYKDFINICG